MSAAPRSDVWLCFLCKAEMSLGERNAHYRGLHPDAFERQRLAFSHEMRLAGAAAATSVVALVLTLFIPSFLRIQVPDWYLVVVVIAFFSPFVPLLVHGAKTGPIVAPYGTLLIPCPICTAHVREGDQRPHFASQHPEELGYFRIAKWVGRGLYLVEILLILPALILLNPLGWVAALPLAISIAPFAVLAILVRRRWTTARAAWNRKG